MIDPVLSEITTGCLLRDILRLDPRVLAEGRPALDKYYGISSLLVWQLTGWDTPDINPSPDGILHLIRHIDKDYLGIAGPLELRALRSPFAGDNGGKNACWFEPSVRCYSQEVNYPEKDHWEVPEACFAQICRELGDFCRIQYSTSGFLHGLLDTLEDLCSFISPDSGTHSLFEIAKLRAGIAACLYLCTQEQKIADYPSYIQRYEAEDKPCVLVCSLDFLGIKDFKFQPAFTERLNEVVAASFYIDLFRENVLDDFLHAAGITRCNLIFSGGRHLHLFLPNLSGMKQQVEAFVRGVNDWIATYFQLDLYISYGMHEATGLTSYESSNGSYYLNIFTKIANQKALVEAHRYSADNLLQINHGLSPAMHHIQARRAMILRLSEEFPGKPYILVSETGKDGIPIGPNRYASAACSLPVRTETVRVYGPKRCSGPIKEMYDCQLIRIWSQDIGAEILPLRCEQPSQMGILRMDIDNFRTYMLHQDTGSTASSPPSKMELSKQFAFFLRRDVPRLLQQYRATNNVGSTLILSIIHEGADDIFIFGQCEHLIPFVGMMYRHYRRFTVEKIGFSAGISIYDPEDQFAANAQLAQQLMDQAKTIPGKNGIVFRDSLHKYKWEEILDYDLYRKN